MEHHVSYKLISTQGASFPPEKLQQMKDKAFLKKEVSLATYSARRSSS